MKRVRATDNYKTLERVKLIQNGLNFHIENDSSSVLFTSLFFFSYSTVSMFVFCCLCDVMSSELVMLCVDLIYSIFRDTKKKKKAKKTWWKNMPIWIKMIKTVVLVSINLIINYLIFLISFNDVHFCDYCQFKHFKRCAHKKHDNKCT